MSGCGQNATTGGAASLVGKKVAGGPNGLVRNRASASFAPAHYCHPLFPVSIGRARLGGQGADLQRKVKLMAFRPGWPEALHRRSSARDAWDSSLVRASRADQQTRASSPRGKSGREGLALNAKTKATARATRTAGDMVIHTYGLVLSARCLPLSVLTTSRWPTGRGTRELHVLWSSVVTAHALQPTTRSLCDSALARNGCVRRGSLRRMSVFGTVIVSWTRRPLSVSPQVVVRGLAG